MDKTDSYNENQVIPYGIYENFLKYVKIPMIIADEDATITKCNIAFEKLTGYIKSEIEGYKWERFIAEESDLNMMKEYNKKRNINPLSVPEEYEIVLLTRTGERKNIALSITNIACTKKCITFLQDITEKKHSEEERIKLEEQLRRSNKLETIGQLAGGIAHDFNNMLAAIMGYSQLAQIRLNKFIDFFYKYYKKYNETKSYENPSCGNNFFEIIESEIHNVISAHAMIEDALQTSQKAGNMTKQLLAFARKQALEVKAVNLNVLIRNFKKMLHHTIRENIDINFSLADNLGFTCVDEGQIEQIILNISLNAQDAMPTGGELSISTENTEIDESYASIHEGSVPGRYIMLKISDTGIGMDKYTLEKIFEPFFTTKETGKGTGLGLATVYGIIKQHKGYITVDSKPGKGTVFRIYLPRSEEISVNSAVPVFINDIPASETILLVEDQPHVRNTISMMLEHQGYRVLQAENGHKALEIAESYNGIIHILLSDIVMPGMNGKELYNKLLDIRPNIRPLFISGYPGEIISDQGIHEEELNLLFKPVLMNDLAEKINDILNKK